jgi:hypothetical protein
MISWKVYKHNPEYQEILVRKIYQMNLDLSEIFRLLKVIIEIDDAQAKNLIMVNLENKLLTKVLEIEHHEY